MTKHEEFKSGERVVLTENNLGALHSSETFDANTIGVIDRKLEDDGWWLIRIGEFNLGVSFVPAHTSMFKKWEG